MGNGIYIAVSGSIAQLDKLDVIANELAQANTTGFKRDIITFESVRYVKPGTQVDVEDLQDKDFVTTRETKVRMEQGTISRSGNPLDVAMQGNGFLRIQTGRGERMTRNGNLMLNRNGALLTNRGQQVLDTAGNPIMLPIDRTLTIDPDGTIRHHNDIFAKLGFIGIADKAELGKDEAGNLEIPELKDQAPLSPNFTVLQGHLEHSTVNAVESMVQLITVQRNFEALHKVIDTYQRVDRTANRVTR